MTDYQQLYQELLEKYTNLQHETQEFLETNKILEEEQEKENLKLNKQLSEARSQKNQLEEELKKNKEKLRTESVVNEKIIEKLKSQVETQKDDLTVKQKKIVELEIDLENERKVSRIHRERDALVKDLELRVDSTLEQLELVKTQLESSRNQSEQQIERLKQQLRENQDELFATKQRSQVELDRITQSVHQSPRNSQQQRKKSQKKYDKLTLFPMTYSHHQNNVSGQNQYFEAETKFKMNIELSKNENEISTRSMKSESPQEENRNNKLDNHFQNCTKNIQQLRATNIGFSKSLDLINALIKDLDDKMQKIKGTTQHS